MKSKDLLFWIWLAEALGAANRDFRRLIDLYRSPYDIFCLENGELERIEPLSPKTVQKLSQKNLDTATKILELCEKNGIGILTFADENYPELLRDISNPPVLLYYRGTIPDWNRSLAIASVGTRKMTAYGMQCAYRLSFELASIGALIVSGMAEGIDGVSAVAAMQAGKPTVAVLGCGVDCAYPLHHTPLMKEIIEKGIVLSEFAPGTKPVSYHFPMRNRIISGISQGVLVVEAGLGSGSLITAKEAVLQGRDVFAVPGNPASGDSVGTNGLLRDGAIFTMESEDVLNRYRYLYADRLHPEKLGEAKKNATPNTAALVRCGVLTPTKDYEHFAEPSLKPVVRPSRAQEKKPAATQSPEAPSESSVANQIPVQRTPAPDTSNLPQIQKDILGAMPQGKTVSIETLNSLGYPFGELIAALTMLEISGRLQKMPGSSYQRK